MLLDPPLSLYVHLPWCVRKCPYCDFNSHALKGEVPEAEYIAALLRDLQRDLPLVQGRPVQTVFLGGGTPSLFKPEAIAELLHAMGQMLPIATGAEVTLEANPGTVERGRFAEYKAAGVTRLSIGVQSLNNEHLRLLGRIHTADEARHAAHEAHAAGLDNFNLDLMYGLPQQTVTQALADIRSALALEPAHLSHYQLAIEPNTSFHAHPPALPDGETVWQMQQACARLLDEHGFQQYEISAYARTNRRCRHNLNYWRFGDYLGIGAGAHGKLTHAQQNQITRMWKIKQPRSYLQHAGSDGAVGDTRLIGNEDRIFEFMLNRLRLYEGFSAEDFETATGLAFSTLLPALEEAEGLKLMRCQAGCWHPSSIGYAFLNDLQARFLPDQPRQPPRRRVHAGNCRTLPDLNLPT
ncbi:MAG: radical SAM family heme chaperone HemW [Gammaproteobacteria bacterium]|nr:radical SAM family heme chaperone HemW [Gammaproteobacteria bacterium]MDE2345349.1 radical SAM family heme chaperone HemW [Gammaproteobacteria bacterium]